MRKIFLLILCLFAIAFSVFAVEAKSTVSIRAENVELKNNRLFDVVIYVDSTFNLAAATFEISYDSTMMEYREVDTEIEKGMVKAADKDGKVKAIFLKSDGISASEEVKIFSAKFKSISTGSCNIEISMFDCVDNNAETFNAEASTQLTVVVSGSNSTLITNDNQKSEIEKTQNLDEEIGKNEDNEERSIKYLDVSTSDDNEKEYLLIIAFMLFVVMGMMLYIFKLKNKKEAPELPENDIKGSDEKE